MFDFNITNDFKFHYGYIQIGLKDKNGKEIYDFKFHYGYIQMAS